MSTPARHSLDNIFGSRESTLKIKAFPHSHQSVRTKARTADQSNKEIELNEPLERIFWTEGLEPLTAKPRSARLITIRAGRVHATAECAVPAALLGRRLIRREARVFKSYAAALGFCCWSNGRRGVHRSQVHSISRFFQGLLKVDYGFSDWSGIRVFRSKKRDIWSYDYSWFWRGSMNDT